MTPTQTVLDALSAEGKPARASGEGWAAPCPAHPDERPSLAIHTGDDGRVLLRCHAGCTAEAVVGAMGLTMADLFPADGERGNRTGPRRSLHVSPATEAAAPREAGHAAEESTAAYEPETPWAARMRPLVEAMTAERWAQLAEAWSLPVEACRALPVGWADGEALESLNPGRPGPKRRGAWAFSERDGGGRVVGLSLRGVGANARKWAATGSKRGLTVPEGHADAQGPVLLVEGASDVAAAAALGLRAIGRPSCTGGVDALAELLAPVPDVLVVGERDRKADGAWPGRDGACDTAAKLAEAWSRPVRWSLVPEGSKDLRAWFGSEAATAATPADRRACGAELLAAVQAAAETAEPPARDEGEPQPRRSRADDVAALAGRLFRLGRSEAGEPFAVELTGPRVALPLRGERGLRARLAEAAWAESGRVCAAAALTDALKALEGKAMQAEPEAVELRLAESGRADTGGRAPTRLVLDLGGTDGAAAVIERGACRVETPGPVLFRRTALTGTHPRPAEGAEPGDLLELQDLLNVAPEAWPLVVGWLIAALVPELDHPVVLMGGEQGTGKSTAARFLAGLVDPSPATLQTQPRDPERWVELADAAWCTVIDNVSTIPPWWSDALCKASTGDGFVKRALYTDGDLVVKRFRRCVLLTSIDAGALAGDLGSRLLLLDLEPIEPGERRERSDLEHRLQRAGPRLLGGLLAAAARTLEAMPGVELTEAPRLADFCRVLAAADAAVPELTGGHALAAYLAQAERIADDVVQADPLAAKVRDLMEFRVEWTGKAAELLVVLQPRDERGDPTRPPRGWPDTPQKVGTALKRAAPALRRLGIEWSMQKSGDRMHTLRKLPEPPA